MENLIGDLIAIEARAHEIAMKSSDYTEEYKRKTKEAAVSIRERVAGEAGERFSAAKDDMERELGAAINKINDDLAQGLIRMEQAYKENGGAAKAAVLSKITGGRG